MREAQIGGSEVWGRWVRDRMKAKQMKARELAAQAQIDPSYVTLIRRDSYIPKRDVCARIGRVLENEETGLIMAGFIALDRRRELKALPRSLQLVIRKLSEATPEVQEQVTSVVLAMLTPAAPMRKRRVSI